MNILCVFDVRDIILYIRDILFFTFSLVARIQTSKLSYQFSHQYNKLFQIYRSQMLLSRQLLFCLARLYLRIPFIKFHSYS